MDEIGQRYLALALHLNRHFEGYVDAYFGPAELKAGVEAGEPRPLAALADDALQLGAAIEASDYGPQRKDFLTRQTRAMATVVDNLSGAHINYLDEVEAYFDIRPEMVDEAIFEAAHAEMDRLLPGEGTVAKRMQAWKRAMELKPEHVLPVFDLALQETRRRTAALFELPRGEELKLQLVADEPWSAYNWYLGDYRSRIDLNTDLPIQVNHAMPLIAHEAYAGHHTEHAIKEHRLYRQQGRAEHAVQLLLAPECVLSEGIADSAQAIIFEGAELIDFSRDELYPLAHLPGADGELALALDRAARDLRWVTCNAALLLHHEGRPAEEVQTYIERYGLNTPKQAAQSMKFIQAPLFRSYIFTYAVGRALLAPLLEEQHGAVDAIGNYGRLLSEPFTPSQVRAWVAGGARA